MSISKETRLKVYEKYNGISEEYLKSYHNKKEL